MVSLLCEGRCNGDKIKFADEWTRDKKKGDKGAHVPLEPNPYYPSCVYTDHRPSLNGYTCEVCGAERKYGRWA